MRPESYRTAARRLRRYADLLDAYAEPARPRDLASLTRTIHSLIQYVRSLSDRHHRR